MGNETIHVKACELLKNGKVAVRVEELRQQHAEKHAVTVESITAELEQARTNALAEKQNSAAVAASMGKAKLHGLDTQKVDVGGDININLTKKIKSADN